MAIKCSTLNILTTVKRQDRYDELQPELKKQGITDVEYWYGEVFKHSIKKGICRGHKKIVQHAKENNLPFIIIAENDIKFCGEEKGAWQYFLDNIPNDYDIYSALCYSGTIKENRIVSQASGFTTLYIVNQRFYDFFLSIPDDCHIDRELSKYWEQFKLLVSPKVAVIQSGSFSDNSKRKCDYSSYLEGRDIYSGG